MDPFKGVLAQNRSCCITNTAGLIFLYHKIIKVCRMIYLARISPNCQLDTLFSVYYTDSNHLFPKVLRI